MSRSALRTPGAAGLLALVVSLGVASAPVSGQVRPPRRQPVVPQVTLFGVLATPGDTTVDQELTTIAPQLKRLLPGHGFKLLGSQSRPLVPGQSLGCQFGDGWSASLEMIDPLDLEGKVMLKFTIHHEGEPSFQRVVRTPPNQLFFCDVSLPQARRLVMGIGAR